MSNPKFFKFEFKSHFLNQFTSKISWNTHKLPAMAPVSIENLVEAFTTSQIYCIFARFFAGLPTGMRVKWPELCQCEVLHLCKSFSSGYSAEINWVCYLLRPPLTDRIEALKFNCCQRTRRTIFKQKHSNTEMIKFAKILLWHRGQLWSVMNWKQWHSITIKL